MLLSAAWAANGLGATFLAEGYTLRVWQTDDGLPQNLVTSAVQTRDGYLWFGTQSGLARFDGERFEVFSSGNTPHFPDRRVSSLFEDEEGTLWIGHDSGAVTRRREGRFDLVEPALGNEDERVIGIGADEEGRIWAMHVGGAVASLEDGSRLPSLIEPEYPGIMDWSADADGNLWVAENGVAARLADGKLAPVALENPASDNYVFGVAASAEGGAWILCDDRVRKWKDGRWTEDRGACPWPSRSPLQCLELRDGTLAVGTIQHGLYLIFGDGRPPARFDSGNGLPQNWVRFVYEDREGNLWAGAGSAGLVSLHPTAFSVLNPSDRWEGRSVMAVAPGRDGSLWIGTDGAGLFRELSPDPARFRAEEGLENQYIQAVTETYAGELWVGNNWWGGPYRLVEGRFVRPASVDPAWPPAVALLAIPDSDALLVGNRDGLLELDGERASWLIKPPHGSAGDVTAIVVDGEGAIWCGFAQGGLARLSEGTVRIFRAEDGLASPAVQCLLADDDGALWIGMADKGLARFKDGKFANVSMEQGLLDDAVCYLLEDDFGHIWISTYHGIQRVAKAELNACADGEIPSLLGQVYDRTDGLPIIEFVGGRQGAACKTSDGRLWFASSKGVACVDPARIATNPLPPPVVVESLLVDGKRAPLASGEAPERLRPDHQRIEIRYAGLSYVAPSKVRFKYRLDGLDKDWIDVGAKRSAFYSHLPPGSYRFRVIACNNDGVWNSEGASLAFSVAPFFWQTWWFVGACLLVALAVVAWSARYFTRLRMQRRIEDMERRHAVERERARIAQDIHDDVGASLSRIAMLSQPTRSLLAEPERAAAVLSGIYNTARNVTRALDEIVWAVNPRHDTLDSLVDYMGKFAQEFLSSANLRCRLDLPVEVPAWPLSAEVRHNLFLAFKEALNNVVKHASATEARIHFGVGRGSFILSVKDNGRGFAASSASERAPDRAGSGNGLENMKSRLRRIGGRCEIAAEPNGGASVTFIVDVAGQGASTSG